MQGKYLLKIRPFCKKITIFAVILKVLSTASIYLPYIIIRR